MSLVLFRDGFSNSDMLIRDPAEVPVGSPSLSVSFSPAHSGPKYG